jgi:hypothetical protein
MDQIVNGRRNEMFKIPIPVVGEAFMVMTEKRGYGQRRDAFELLDALIKKDRLKLWGFGYDSKVFECAKQITDVCSEPMDALITATALVDTECRKLYTMDATLIANEDTINDIGSGVMLSDFQKVEFTPF